MQRRWSEIFSFNPDISSPVPAGVKCWSHRSCWWSNVRCTLAGFWYHIAASGSLTLVPGIWGVQLQNSFPAPWLYQDDRYGWLVRVTWCWSRDSWEQQGNSLFVWYWYGIVTIGNSQFLYVQFFQFCQVCCAFQPDQRIRGRLSLLLRRSREDPAVKE